MNSWNRWINFLCMLILLMPGAKPAFAGHEAEPGPAKVSVTGAFTVQAVSAGGSHTCALTPAGGVECWGWNNDGQLGDGTIGINRGNPVKVEGLESGVTALSAGGSHTCALTESGGLKCWGNNGSGQLGDGSGAHGKLTPVDVQDLASGVAAVSARGDHTCAMTELGEVKCWGANGYGQLGDGTTTNQGAPVSVTGLSGSIQAVSAGGNHTCVLTAAGDVLCWGANSFGQLGDGTTTDRSTPVAVKGLPGGNKAISAGGSHTCVLTAVDGVKCWGDGSYGKLGDGSGNWTNSSSPLDVAGLSGGVVELSAGGSHTCARMAAGSVRCWGNNLDGQLGDGRILPSPNIPGDVSGLSGGVLAISAGGDHTCAIVTGGGLKCWGENFQGQLGDGTIAYLLLSPLDVKGLSSGIQAVSSGADHTCALTTAGGVKCWGNNDYGQLGDGTQIMRSTPVDVIGLSSGVAAVSAGWKNTCAVMLAGGVKCWGSNDYDQLGSTTSDYFSASPLDVAPLSSGVKSVSVGYGHACALTLAGGVKCWGSNSAGQLGSGSSGGKSAVPMEVTGLSSGVTAVSAGGQYTCALAAGGAVKCWGWNDYGQLGNSTYSAQNTPVNVTGLASGVKAVSAGNNHTCAVSGAGGVMCWGSAGLGQLGTGTLTRDFPYPVNVSAIPSGANSVHNGYSHTCAVTATGGVKCWGENDYGQVGDGTLKENRFTPVDVVGFPSGVASVSLGWYHSCALTAAGGVKCWGNNEYGQLGYKPLWVPVDVIKPLKVFAPLILRP